MQSGTHWLDLLYFKLETIFALVYPSLPGTLHLASHEWAWCTRHMVGRINGLTSRERMPGRCLYNFGPWRLRHLWDNL